MTAQRRARATATGLLATAVVIALASWTSTHDGERTDLVPSVRQVLATKVVELPLAPAEAPPATEPAVSFAATSASGVTATPLATSPPAPPSAPAPPTVGPRAITIPPTLLPPPRGAVPSPLIRGDGRARPATPYRLPAGLPTTRDALPPYGVAPSLRAAPRPASAAPSPRNGDDASFRKLFSERK